MIILSLAHAQKKHLYMYYTCGWCAYIRTLQVMSAALRMGLSGTLRRTVPGHVLAPSSYPVQVRGKKQQKKPAKTKKDAKREMMKEYFKQLELKQVMEEASLRAAKHGEPLDPEMLNPARKRAPASISPEERERRFLVVKEYSRYCMEKHKKELALLQGILQARRKALLELKKISFPLYQQALELSQDLLPFTHTGPTTTPPIPNYQPPELEE